MATARISKRSIDAFTCPAGKDRELLWDNALSGFGLCAFPTGKKVYVVQYRQAGRSRRVTIGDHGRLTPDEARSEAKKLLGAVEGGSDPIAERQEARAVRTFEAVADDFLASHVATKRKSRTAAEYERLLKVCILPAIGQARIKNIRRVDVARLHSSMAGSPYQANRVLALISSIWNWAASRDEVSAIDNPAKGIERYPEHGKERFLTSDELARLGDALRLCEAKGIDPFAIAAVRLLILTGARLQEILTLKWSYLDIERGVLFLPDSKTGKKPVYISAAALSILASLPRLEGNPYIIAGSKEGHPRADLKKPWTAICKAAALEGVRLHDLRHSFASFGAGASLGLPIIGKLLGHSQAATTHRYAHLDADPMRRAVETIGSTISAAMGGKSADVVPIKRPVGV